MHELTVIYDNQLSKYITSNFTNMSIMTGHSYKMRFYATVVSMWLQHDRHECSMASGDAGIWPGLE